MVIMKLGNELVQPFMEVLDFLGREHNMRVVVEPHVFEEHIKGQPDFPFVYTFDSFSDRDRWAQHARPLASCHCSGCLPGQHLSTFGKSRMSPCGQGHSMLACSFDHQYADTVMYAVVSVTPLCPPGRLAEYVDFVVCMGGDGVILHSSYLFKHSMPPVSRAGWQRGAGAKAGWQWGAGGKLQGHQAWVMLGPKTG